MTTSAEPAAAVKNHTKDVRACYGIDLATGIPLHHYKSINACDGVSYQRSPWEGEGGRSEKRMIFKHGDMAHG